MNSLENQAKIYAENNLLRKLFERWKIQHRHVRELRGKMIMAQSHANFALRRRAVQGWRDAVEVMKDRQRLVNEANRIGQKLIRERYFRRWLAAMTEERKARDQDRRASAHDNRRIIARFWSVWIRWLKMARDKRQKMEAIDAYVMRKRLKSGVQVRATMN